MAKNYDCWFCRGQGTLSGCDCEDCCCDVDCHHCEATGLDSDLVDTTKWKQAEAAFQAECLITCELQNDKRENIGRVSLRDESKKLLIADFLLKDESVL